MGRRGGGRRGGRGGGRRGGRGGRRRGGGRRGRHLLDQATYMMEDRHAWHSCDMCGVMYFDGCYLQDNQSRKLEDQSFVPIFSAPTGLESDATTQK
ncbi:unnamed protein product [Aphanomyces euteiches]